MAEENHRWKMEKFQKYKIKYEGAYCCAFEIVCLVFDEW